MNWKIPFFIFYRLRQAFLVISFVGREIGRGYWAIDDCVRISRQPTFAFLFPCWVTGGSPTFFFFFFLWKKYKSTFFRRDFMCEMFYVPFSFSLQVGGYFNFVLWRFINPEVDFMVFTFSCSIFIFFISDINSFCKSRKIYYKDGYPWRRNWPRNWPPWPFNVSIYFSKFYGDPVAFSYKIK